MLNQDPWAAGQCQTIVFQCLVVALRKVARAAATNIHNECDNGASHIHMGRIPGAARSTLPSHQIKMNKFAEIM